VYALAYDGGTIYAGGDFTFSSRQQVRHLAKWDGHLWSPVNKGTDGPVYTILPTNEGLFVGGKFKLAGATLARNVAMLSADGDWLSLGEGFDDDVRGLARSDGGWLYATGRFTHSGAAVINRIARWDGREWSRLGSGLDNTGRDVIAAGKHIYVAGYFMTAGTIPSQYFAEWMEHEPAGGPTHEHPTLAGSRTPASTSLAQNAPNPFNPTTRIPFTLATSAQVRLAIYDAQGKLVRTLLDRQFPAGEHFTSWNGTDERGAPVASGVYFCAMRAGTIETTRKMLLLK
jgi:hypothetical protein